MPSKRQFSLLTRSLVAATVAVGAAAAVATAAGKVTAPVFADGRVLGSHGLKDEVTSNIYGGPAVQRNADIASDGAGQWMAVWHSTEPVGDDIDGTYDIVLSRSIDGGKTWSEKDVVAPDHPGDLRDDLSPTVRTDGKGLWLLAWTSRGSLGSELGIDGDILLSRSTDNGVTWSVPSMINQGAREDWGTDVDVRLAHDGNGNWLAVWSSTETFGGKYGGDSDIFTARSVDGGLTWSPPTVLNTNATSDLGFDITPDVGSAGDGAWLTVWSAGDSLKGRIGIDRDILISRSTDGGATWTDPARLNSQAPRDQGSDWAPRFATDGRGKWIAAWSSAVNLEGIRGKDRDILYSASTDNGVTWSPAANLDADAANDAREDTGPVVVTDGKGRWGVMWHSWGGISYRDGSDADILVSFSDDDAKTWSDPAPVDRAAGQDTSDDLLPTMATDDQGHWVGVWQTYFPSTGSVARAEWRMIAAAGTPSP
ncbi:MAG TPA: sialidase family protein [Candidatus Binatia bacterium]|nr:sialidase family protein [Candidatus Binatia bacterium]